MDTRNGDIYPSREAAIDAGVPPEYVAEVVTITSGPFKGRKYLRENGKLGRCLSGNAKSKRHVD